MMNSGNTHGSECESEAPIDRRLTVSREAQAQILQLYATGVETRSLAERFGVQDHYIRKLASRHGVKKGRYSGEMPQSPERSKPQVRNAHIAPYKKARRGFSVPPHLEAEYTKLLIGGLSRVAAAHELGLMSPTTTTGSNIHYLRGGNAFSQQSA